MIEQSYEHYLTSDQPLFFGLEQEPKGWAALFAEIHDPIIAFFKKDNQWHGCNRNTKHSNPVTNNEIRQIFAICLMQVGISVESLANDNQVTGPQYV